MKTIPIIPCLLSLLLATVASGQEATPPVETAPVEPSPVKVYILLGQSNMLGFGKVGPEDRQGTLEYVTRTEKKYPEVVGADGKWKVRDDVRYVHVMQNGKEFSTERNEWLTVGEQFIGPELMIGHLLGDHHEETVLVLKACIGNRALGWDYLPPGSERFEYRGKTFGGYRDVKFSWTEGEGPDTDWENANWYAGKQYDDDTRYAKTVLANLGTYVPGATNYEIGGFFWFQGHKDQSKVMADRYEQNLVRFIKSLRTDFDAPDAPFVLATIAFGGRRIAGDGLKIVKAQLAVSGEEGNYPEFEGNVKSVDARPFWQPSHRSPSGDGTHYNNNALTYLDVGNGMGKAMVELLEGKSN